MLLGVSGFAGSGKDTVADFLTQDLRFNKVALADPLKRICRDVYAFTDEQLWGPSQFRNTPDPRYPRPCRACGGGDSSLPCALCGNTGKTFLTTREALQRLGTEWGRECYPNTWVDLAIRTAKTLLRGGPIEYSQQYGLITLDASPRTTSGVAIPDVRFRNELTAIRAAGGKVIRVFRPGAGLDGSGALHLSETEQAGIHDSEFDAVIQNTGTLEDLRNLTTETILKLR